MAVEFNVDKKEASRWIIKDVTDIMDTDKEDEVYINDMSARKEEERKATWCTDQTCASLNCPWRRYCEETFPLGYLDRSESEMCNAVGQWILQQYQVECVQALRDAVVRTMQRKCEGCEVDDPSQDHRTCLTLDESDQVELVWSAMPEEVSWADVFGAMRKRYFKVTHRVKESQLWAWWEHGARPYLNEYWVRTVWWNRHEVLLKDVCTWAMERPDVTRLDILCQLIEK